MEIFRKLEDVPDSIGPTVLSVGNFDGVHRAHTHVLKQIADRAREQGKVSMAVTFEPHPARLLRPGCRIQTDYADRRENKTPGSDAESMPFLCFPSLILFQG